MRHKKHRRHYVGNSVIKQKPIIQSQISILLVVTLLSLSVFGCGTIFMREGKYETPDLPKSELATIQVDTKGKWIQRTNLIALRINGKLALRKEIGENKDVSIDEILVVPGKQDISVLIVYESYDEGTRATVQTSSSFDADVKAGGIYLLKGDFTYIAGGEFSFELVNADTDRVVSKPKIFDLQNGRISFKVK
ncbi:MAG: hypothetical protein OXU23_25395 [Candidatus Poribacteria bacterium]|nr:hypothetical protein [Candidatus Poribacteria bacterium]MDE0313322.1 hypothetical protein [Candidatus Poribacteria bacterium]